MNKFHVTKPVQTERRELALCRGAARLRSVIKSRCKGTAIPRKPQSHTDGKWHTKTWVCEMPQTGDCGGAENPVPLHPDI